MTYRIPLPAGGARSKLDVIDPFSSMVQRFVRRQGLSSYEPETAAALLALFELQEGPFVFYDVGSNIGLYSHMCAAMFEGAEVISFEPTPDVAEIARSIGRANGLSVRIVEAAASDVSGTAQLHLSQTSDASNSLVEGFKESRGVVTVKLLRLDDFRHELGRGPAVLKIDVETHEPEVLAGAVEMIKTDRPYVVIEVLRRRGNDQGAAIQAIFEGLGYSYYELAPQPDWIPRDKMRGSGTIARDWLLAPQPLDEEFGAAWARWEQRLAECTPERNSRVPIGGAAAAAYRRGGISELVLSGRRFVSEDLAVAVRRRMRRKTPR